jgi:hypothetical protein
MSNEREFQNAVVEALQLHLYLVNHNPTSATTAGFRTVLDYDARGSSTSSPCARGSCDRPRTEGRFQTVLRSEGLAGAGRGDGRYASVLTPRQMPAFLAHLDAIDEQYPVPRGWKATLTSRSMRRGLKRLNTQVTTGAKSAPDARPTPIGSAVTVQLRDPGVHPARRQHRQVIHGLWADGLDGVKWVPHPKSRKRVCFRSIPATSVLKLAKESSEPRQDGPRGPGRGIYGIASGGLREMGMCSSSPPRRALVSG